MRYQIVAAVSLDWGLLNWLQDISGTWWVDWFQNGVFCLDASKEARHELSWNFLRRRERFNFLGIILVFFRGIFHPLEELAEDRRDCLTSLTGHGRLSHHHMFMMASMRIMMFIFFWRMQSGGCGWFSLMLSKVK